MERKEILARKPKFSKHEAGQKGRIKSSWRRPKGLQNKMRLGVKGYKKPIAQGYRMPSSLRDHDTKTGLAIATVSNLKDLEQVDAKTTGIIIAAAVGMRKKETIIAKAKEQKITILNIKDADNYVSNFKKNKEERKKQLAARKKVQEENKKAAEKKEKKADKAESVDKEAAEKQEKKEQEKVLIHKE